MIDQNEKWLYRAGGVSGLLIALGYIIIIIVYVFAGARPDSGEAWLTYLATKTTVWWIIISLSVITDILFIPVLVALYSALKGINKGAMWLGTMLVGLFVLLDLGLTWPNFSSLISLSASYTAATNDVQRASYVAAANYAFTQITSPLLSSYIILIPSLGILIISLVMLKGVFSKATAYVGIATGVLGTISVVGPLLVDVSGFVAVVLASTLTLIWCFLVGYKFYRVS